MAITPDSATNSMEAFLPKLPQDVHIMEFARHRAEELASLTACINGSELGGGNKRIFQQLPHHMRRRAMSHNVKRVPRRLREIHKREIEKTGKKASKRPSRKHRRRPSNLLQAYNRRQREFVWLETHIWHAKRFKMDACWGYKIPRHPCDKSVRACYHAAIDSALLQDISYLCCIELVGRRSDLLDGLARLTHSECGLTFASVMHSDGTREGSTLIYHDSQYPYGAIGPVTFHWWPDEGRQGRQGSSRLWLWSHPAIFRTILDELIEVFQLEPVGVEGRDDHFAEFTRRSKEFEKLSVKLGPFYEQPPIYRGGSITLTSLKDQLIRFRLLGQWSTAVLTSTLQVAEVATIDIDDSDFDRIASEEQAAFWAQMSKYPVTSRVAPGSIIGLTVRDPRESLPMERNRVLPDVPEANASNGLLPVTTRISHSRLCSGDVRESVTLSKMPDAEMNRLRSQHLIPGTPVDLGVRGSKIPVLLIQQSFGSCPSGTQAATGCGWDLVLPAGWGMAFWIPLVYRGARVGGLREMESLIHESHCLHFPDDYPDTDAGSEDEERTYRELKNKYFKYPPSKRPNFVKLGIAAPFHFPWNKLVTEWSTELSISTPDEDKNRPFFVMRKRSMLRGVGFLLRHVGQRTSIKSIIPRNRLCIPAYSKAIVGIRLSMVGRGALVRFAVICTPNAADLAMLDSDPRYSGPCEPNHPDSTRDLRSRVAAPTTWSSLDSEMASLLQLDGADDFERLFTAAADGLLSSCSRPILGWVKSGRFSFTEGRVTGLAFVGWCALLHYLESAVRPIVLVRAPHSYQYHFAEFTIRMTPT